MRHVSFFHLLIFSTLLLNTLDLRRNPMFGIIGRFVKTAPIFTVVQKDLLFLPRVGLILQVDQDI